MFPTSPRIPLLPPYPPTAAYHACLQVYISGHGGNEFMKFQDTEELMAQVG